MPSETTNKKRKGAVVEAASATKKVKTAASAEKPAPLKSALKKEKASKKTVETVRPDKDGGPKKVPTKAAAAEVVEPAVVETVKPEKVKKSKKASSQPQAEAAVEETEEKLIETVKVDKSKKPKKTTTKAPAVIIEQTVTEGIEDDTTSGGADLTADQTAALLAGFSSSEDEASGDEEDGVAISKLPQVPGGIAEAQKQIKEARASDPERTPGVIYLGRIPHGFYEHQMRAYFSQFGDITHIRLARNKKTGKSQHYGFIEFASAAVATIVAKTMDKYLMFGRILQVRVVPPGQIEGDVWKGSGKRKKPAPRNRLEGGLLKRGAVREDWEMRVEREGTKRAAKKEKMAELGYEFEMPVLKGVESVPVKAKQIKEAAPAQADESAPAVVEAEAPAAEIETEVIRIAEQQPHKVVVVEEKKTSKKRSSLDANPRKVSKKPKTK